ncbi:helix-turn-helix domain-containing protein [Actinacidiphila glaucinigra]|uniref:helix-turn-helix domain-containing protein n=1 Tax=Actinacidiphila glaucinigra TaxID=235986 RepID=UPI003D8E438E
MARWRPLADDLDPRVREFTEALRRQVDRGGLSVAALAEATGYSRSSWERYLGGRLLPPRYAVVALAEATGADPAHFTTMWEVTERVWSRAEGRHDVTMEAVRIAEARAALGGFGPAPAAPSPAAPSPAPSPAPAAPAPAAPAPAAPVPAAPAVRRRPVVLFVAGVVAVVLAVVGVTALTGGDGDDRARPGPSRTARAAALPAGVKCTGQECTGKDPEGMGCGGGNARTAAAAWVGGAYVEMRYSRVCAAVWARISAGAPGDTVSVTEAGGTRRSQRSRIGRDPEAYTSMLAVRAPGAARACATLTTGSHGCAAPPPG